MENMSKALIIAGGMLLSVMILGLLSLSYRNLAELEQEKDKITESNQSLEFNKKFDHFIRENVQGIEVISAANLISEYNKTEAKFKGNQKIEMKVIISKKLDKEVGFLSKHNEYDLTSISNEYDNLTNNIKTIKDDVYKKTGRDIDFFANMRDKDKDAYGRDKIPEDDIYKYQKYKNEMNKYKRKVFTGKAEYNTIGRISKMIFEEN